MQEITDALDAMQKSIESLVETQQATERAIAGLQAQLDEQKKVNEAVQRCLKLALGLKDQRPKLEIVPSETDESEPTPSG